MSTSKFKENLGLVGDLLTVIGFLISVASFVYPVIRGNGTPILKVSPETKFGILSKSDLIFLSALLGIIVLWEITYVTWIKTPHNQFLRIVGFSLDAITIWFYFRFWIGIKWWMYICLIPVIALVFIMIFLFSKLFNFDIGSSNSPLAPPSKDIIEKNDSRHQTANLTTLSPFVDNSFLVGYWNKKPQRLQPMIQIPDGIDPFMKYVIHDIARSYDKDLPIETNRQMVDLTNYLLHHNLLEADFAMYHFQEFVNKVKDQQTLTYSDVLMKFGKDAADKINFK